MSDGHLGSIAEMVTLDWLKVAVRNAVSEEFLTTVRAEVIHQEIWGTLLVQLTAKVLAESLPPETVTAANRFEIFVPASPWQQFKQDHAATWWLRWLVRRRPPVERLHVLNGELTVNLRRYWSYPEARVMPQMGQPVRVALVDQLPRWWEDEGSS